jgi:large subunit ribosomal protein L23
VPALTVDQVIVRPLITEKNTDLMEQDQYTFEVATVANKIQIREAVEKLFNVRVKAVNTMNVKGSRRSRAIRRGRSRIY